MFQRFWGSTRGNFSVVFAMGAIAIMFSVATATDYAAALRKHNMVQDSLDAAALYGAGLASDPALADASIKEMVETFFHSNLGEGELVSSAIYVDVDRVNNQVSTRLAYEDGLIFGGILVPGIRTGKVVSDAVYAPKTSGGLCVLSLHKSAANAITIDGASDVNAPECDFMANSPTVAQAVYFKGSGKTIGKSFCAVGDHTSNGSRSVWPAPQDFCAPVADPFADWTPPKEGRCDFRKNEFRIKSATEVRLQPGHYCTAVDIQAPSIVFEPGMYFFSDSLVLNANDSVVGEGVYLQFTSLSKALTITGGASTKLTKIPDPKLRDIVVYIDPASAISPGLQMTGNSDLVLNGAIYAPMHNVYLTGRTSLYSDGVQTALIASKVYLSGNTYIVIKPLPALSGSNGPSMVHLVK